MTKLLFDHLPKCAGTSVYQLLQTLVGANRVSPHVQAMSVGNAVRLFSRYDVIAGHFTGEILIACPFTIRLLTIVRDPVNCLMSLYRYSRSVGRGAFADTLREMSFIEFVRSEHPFLTAPLDNYLTTHFADALGRVTNSDDLLSMAKQAVAGYDVVGIFSDIDETARKICQLFGLTAVAMPKINASDKSESEEIDPDAVRVIKSRNSLDFELYDFIAKQFYQNATKENAVFYAEEPYHPSSGAPLEFGSREVQIEDLTVRGADATNNKSKQVYSGEVLEITLSLVSQIREADLALSLEVTNLFGDLVYGINTYYVHQTCSIEPKVRRYVRISLPVNLGYGTYYLTFNAHRARDLVRRRYFHRMENAFRLDVLGLSREIFLGQTNLRAAIEVS